MAPQILIYILARVESTSVERQIYVVISFNNN